MLLSKKKHNYFYLFFYLYILIVLNLIVPLLLSPNECDIETPFLYKGKCTSAINCPPDYIENGTCEINNEIIKVQWLNNIIHFNNYNDIKIKSDYADIITTSNGNLVLLTSGWVDQHNGKRLFYILKKDGKGYFINENDETPFYLVENLLDIKNNGNFYSIKLNNTNEDKEYIISISSNNNLDIYDFNGRIYYSKSLNELYSRDYYYQDISTFVESEKNYFFGFIGKNEDKYSFIINKLNFNSTDMNNISPIISYNNYKSSNSRIVSCYKTEQKYIICFYQNENYIYEIIVFNENLDLITNDGIYQEKKRDNYFFKCVHFFKEVGVFSFFNSEDRLFIFKFKLLTNNKKFINYYSQRDNFSLPLENLEYSIDKNDIIKINDKTICFTSLNTQSNSLYLVLIYDYINVNIKIRYFKINLNLYSLELKNKLSIALYNNFICLTSTYSKIKSYENYKKEESSFLIIFSYPNSKDFEVDITNNLKQYQNITIDLNSKCNIDNNIFGLIPKEIKIINFSEKFELFSSKDYRKINKGDSINTNENIILILSKKASINIPKVGKIIYSMVITEPDYDYYMELANKSNYFWGDNEKIGDFRKNNYIGRHSYCNIKIDQNKIKNHCFDNNCKLCLFENDKKCVYYKYDKYNLKNADIRYLYDNTDTNNDEDSSIEDIYTSTENTYTENTDISLSDTSESDTTESTTNTDIADEIDTSISDTSTSDTTATITDIGNEIDSTTSDTTVIDKLNCTKDEIINNKCNKGIIYLNQINDIKNDLLKLSNNNNTILIQTDNMNIQIATEEEEKKDIPDVSNIDLGECGNILKKHYNISENELLNILIIDIKPENSSSTYVHYEVYDPTKKYK